MRTRHHIHMSIAGALNQSPKQFHRSFDGVVTDDKDRPISPEAFRSELEGLRDQGHKLFPMSSECTGFDPFEKGCPGHPIKETTFRELATHPIQDGHCLVCNMHLRIETLEEDLAEARATMPNAPADPA